jgi:hypothetical protein
MRSALHCGSVITSAISTCRWVTGSGRDIPLADFELCEIGDAENIADDVRCQAHCVGTNAGPVLACLLPIGQAAGDITVTSEQELVGLPFDQSQVWPIASRIWSVGSRRTDKSSFAG